MMGIARPLVFAVAAALCAAPAAAQRLAPTELQALPRAFPPAAQFDAPFARAAFDRARADVAPYLARRPDVPRPIDPGGGYTHERHKDNYRIIRSAGALYAATRDRAYADLARDILLAYAELYPTLDLHPVEQSRQRGRLFWQSLNDTVWLVESIQGYADVRDALTAEERQRIEANVFRPMAEFLSVGSAPTFSLIHNHAAWAAAAVGITGYVLGEETFVRRALYGLSGDGGSGFYKQIDELFSPDGYYAEGPYYARYAIMPFVAFARTIQIHEPQREIFAYRDGVLLRAITNLVQQTYEDRFFPINDYSDKGLNSPEILHAVALAYALTGDPALLSVAAEQGRVVFTPEGMALAEALARGEARPFPFASMLLRDGPDGNRGGLAIMRNRARGQNQALVFEATAQGMGHGHFDRLSWLFYDNGREIVTDYGAARFINVRAKDGGRYLPENNTWTRQTVAHNTLVVDEESQFGGETTASEPVATRVLHFSTSDVATFSAAQVEGAYDGVSLRRAMALIDLPERGRTLVVDLLRADARTAHRYDVPLHYRGALTETSLAFTQHATRLEPVGVRAGYRHLWRRADAPVGGPGQLRWFNEGRHYSYSFASPQLNQAVLVELGANDPNDNLRPERGVLLRGEGAQGFAFAAVLEAHGDYSSAEEYARDAEPLVAGVRLVSQNGRDAVVIEFADGQRAAVGVSWDRAAGRNHTVRDGAHTYSWRGFAALAFQGGRP